MFAATSSLETNGVLQMEKRGVIAPGITPPQKPGDEKKIEKLADDAKRRISQGAKGKPRI
mgnify:CR=1 FL=1